MTKIVKITPVEIKKIALLGKVPELKQNTRSHNKTGSERKLFFTFRTIIKHRRFILKFFIPNKDDKTGTAIFYETPSYDKKEFQEKKTWDFAKWITALQIGNYPLLFVQLNYSDFHFFRRMKCYEELTMLKKERNRERKRHENAMKKLDEKIKAENEKLFIHDIPEFPNLENITI